MFERAWEEFLRLNQNSETAELLIPEIVNSAVKAKTARCRVLQTQDRWFGVTYHDDLEQVRAAIARFHADGLYPTPLF
jgi:hypothetical protein